MPSVFFSFLFVFFLFFLNVSKWWKTLPCIKLRAKRGAGCVQCFVLTRVSCLCISLKSHPCYAHITFLCIYPFCCDLCLSSLFISRLWKILMIMMFSIKPKRQVQRPSSPKTHLSRKFKRLSVKTSSFLSPFKGKPQ